jgi:hypothetical protein
MTTGPSAVDAVNAVNWSGVGSITCPTLLPGRVARGRRSPAVAEIIRVTELTRVAGLTRVTGPTRVAGLSPGRPPR